MAFTTAAHQIIQMAGAMSDSEQLPSPYWELVERHRGPLVNQALSIVGNLEDAEDVVQETFLETFRHGKKLAQIHSLGAWLRALNRANALNRLRHKKRHAKHEGRKKDEARARAITTGGFSLVEIRETIAKAIEKLPPKLRLTIILRYWEGLSYDEIAARLQVPPGSARRMFCEASSRLHERLKPVFQPGPSASAAPGSTSSGSGQTSGEDSGNDNPA